jgi:hypothetical protein
MASEHKSEMHDSLALSDDERLLIYVGHHPDDSFPWGGYHITITGRTVIDIDTALEIVRKACIVFPLVSSSTSSSSCEKPWRGFRLKKENIHAIEKQSDGMYMVFIRHPRLDSFAALLRQYGGEQLPNIKSNWHISMHCSDLKSVQRQVEHWTGEDGEGEGDYWGIFFNYWNNATSTSRWLKMEE